MRDNEQLGSIIMGSFEWDLAELTGKFGHWIDKNEQKKKKEDCPRFLSWVINGQRWY